MSLCGLTRASVGVSDKVTMTAEPHHGQSKSTEAGCPGSSPRRPWYRRQYRVHCSTWVVALVAAALWTLVIFAPERRVLPDRVEHGWTLTFSTRYKPSSGLRPLALMLAARTDESLRIPQEPELWAWPDARTPCGGWLFWTNVGIAAIGLTVLTVLVERRRCRVRTFWQLSLREIAALVLLAAIPCAWWGSLYRETQRQARALESLDNVLTQAVYGDGISSTKWQSRYEVQWQSKGDWFLELVWDEATKPRWFAEVISLKLTVEQDAADEVVALVGRLPSLQELSIDVYGGSRRLADESVPTIAGLRGLRSLALRRIGHNWDTSVIGLSDAQVAHLASLTDLRTLDLTNNHVTDEGLRHLHGLKRLEVLEISNNPITDDGVSELTQSIPGLMVLDD
jgi:hypothetical protein